MNKKSLLFISGLLAVAIYFFIVGVLFFYFNTHSEKESVHYVKKNENRISVTLSTPKSNSKNKEKISHHKKDIKSNKSKKVKKNHKKVLREKVVQKIDKKPKRVIKKKVKQNINKPKDLFTDINSDKKVDMPIKKVPKKTTASDLLSSLKIQKKSDKGIEDSYKALIEEKLLGWPAQSEYAGERAIVWLKIEPSGNFVFKLKVPSSNEEFNIGLISYLKQLQTIGFAKHPSNRAYTLDVNFIATE